jgi:hypothetical protein
MPRVGFESTIPVFERAKTFYVLGRAVTVFGNLCSRKVEFWTSTWEVAIISKITAVVIDLWIHFEYLTNTLSTGVAQEWAST